MHGRYKGGVTRGEQRHRGSNCVSLDFRIFTSNISRDINCAQKVAFAEISESNATCIQSKPSPQHYDRGNKPTRAGDSSSADRGK